MIQEKVGIGQYLQDPRRVQQDMMLEIVLLFGSKDPKNDIQQSIHPHEEDGPSNIAINKSMRSKIVELRDHRTGFQTY
jgi:hypothetical protein